MNTDQKQCSSKTLKESSQQNLKPTNGETQSEHPFCSMSLENWKELITTVRSEYSQRLKSEHHINVNGFISWANRDWKIPKAWSTPTVDDSKNNAGPAQFNRKGVNGQPRKLNLNCQAVVFGHQDQDNINTNGNHQEPLEVEKSDKIWPTPTTGRITQQLSPSQLKRNSLNLAMTVEVESEKMPEQFPTPRSSDAEGGRIETIITEDGFKSKRHKSNQFFGAKLRDAVETMADSIDVKEGRYYLSNGGTLTIQNEDNDYYYLEEKQCLVSKGVINQKIRNCVNKNYVVDYLTLEECDKLELNMWPTASVCGNHNRKGASATSGDGLSTAVKAEKWLTPRVCEISEDYDTYIERMQNSGNPKNVGKTNAQNLSMQVDMNKDNWATPNTMDCLPSRSFDAMKRQATNGGRKNRQRPGNLREQIDPEMQRAYDEARIEANLPKWATPNTMDHLPPKRGEALERNKKKGGCKNLREDVDKEENWPTPRAGTPGSRPNGKGGKILNEEAVKHGNWGTPRVSMANDKQEDSGKHRIGEQVQGLEKEKRVLNSRWVETLMGVPIGWTLPSCEVLNDKSIYEVVDNRTDELRLLGNGVCVPTVATAFDLLITKLNKPKYWYGDLISEKLESECFICITTNGFVKSNGQAVMGKGIAKQISERCRTISYKLGTLIKKNGNIVQPIGKVGSTIILSFPVKPISGIYDGGNAVEHMKSKFNIGDQVPGWACKADIGIIQQSIQELLTLTEKYDYDVYLPKPGCGAGELEWSEVKPLLETNLNNNHYICDFKE